jgi:hypothetical protein
VMQAHATVAPPSVREGHASLPVGRHARS